MLDPYLNHFNVGVYIKKKLKFKNFPTYRRVEIPTLGKELMFFKQLSRCLSNF